MKIFTLTFSIQSNIRLTMLRSQKCFDELVGLQKSLDKKKKLKKKQQTVQQTSIIQQLSSLNSAVNFLQQAHNHYVVTPATPLALPAPPSDPFATSTKETNEISKEPKEISETKEQEGLQTQISASQPQLLVQVVKEIAHQCFDQITKQNTALRKRGRPSKPQVPENQGSVTTSSQIDQKVSQRGRPIRHKVI
jgi:hypothetical protein